MKDSFLIDYLLRSFNSELAYKTISQIDLELELRIYDLEDKQICFNNYRTKLIDMYQNIKNIIAGIIVKITVVKLKAFNFERNFPSVESL